LALNVIQQPLAKHTTQVTRPRKPYEPDMVFISGGCFLIPNPVSEQQNEIRVTDFEISKYLVTQAQWLAVMGINPSHFKGYNLPVENISLLDVEEFIGKLNTKTQQRYRLPSEDEWEYACRAGTNTAFYTGDTVSSTQANYEGDTYKEQTTPVGSYPPNPWGLYDMMGNVWEWTASDYQADECKDKDSKIRRIVRGGSWFDSVAKLQSATRFAIKPDSRNFDLGFRLASDICTEY
jgi:formylglycine-generating enzyme required for sulfatase activity